MPLVSVLMTAYNREAFIADAIESVLAQTFTDFELVIVDDASRDGTVSIANQYAARDRRIRVVVNEKNLGDYPNRNRAATLARGEFLKYHDSDDLLYPYCLEVMLALLLAFPQAAFSLAGAKEWPGGPCPMLLTPRMAYQREFLGTPIFNLGPACAMFRTEVFRRLGCFPEAGPHSDGVFWLKACATEPIVLAPGNLFWYRVHAGQHLRGPGGELDSARACRRPWDALNSASCPLSAEECELAKRNWTWRLGRVILRHLSRARFSLAWAYFRNSGIALADWLHYFRRERRQPFAGTPTDAAGNFLAPEWESFAVQRQVQRNYSLRASAPSSTINSSNAIRHNE